MERRGGLKELYWHFAPPLAAIGLLVMELHAIFSSPVRGTETWWTGTGVGVGFALPLALGWLIRARSADGGRQWHPWQYFAVGVYVVAFFLTHRAFPLPEAGSVEVIAGYWYCAVVLLNFPLVLMQRRRVPDPVPRESRPLTRTAKFKRRSRRR
jgi:hypothetical protein